MSLIEFNIFEKKWSLLTQHGNSLFKDKNYKSALKYYQKALYYGEMLIRNAENAQKFNLSIASPFFVSCFNIANIFWELNDLKKADNYFFYNIWQLKMLINKFKEDSTMYEESIKNWEKAVLCLIDFYSKTGKELRVDFWHEETYKLIKNERQFLVNRSVNLN